MKLFLQLTKVDVEKREVWGRATQEIADKSGEIFDYESSAPLFREWSGEFDKATDGLSLGNVRAMHGKVAAGKVISIEYNDAEKAIDIGAKIVDKAEWEKVTEALYTGFSIGGEYVKKWKDGPLTRFTARPAEISLVDNPCVPSARFSMVKSDGSVEETPFRDPVEQIWTCGEAEHHHTAKADAVACREAAVEKAKGASNLPVTPIVTNLPNVVAPLSPVGNTTGMAPVGASPGPGTQPMVEDSVNSPAGITANENARPRDPDAQNPGTLKADAPKGKYGDVKYADTKNKKYPIDTEEHIRAAWSYINKEKDAAEYSAAELKAVKARIIAAWKRVIDKAGPPSAKADKLADDKTPTSLKKGLWSVGDLAIALQNIGNIAASAAFEAQWEQDGSELPAKLKAWLAEGVPILQAMVTEETAEMLDELEEIVNYAAVPDETVTIQSAAKAPVMKASAADKDRMQAIHDHAASMGADCAASKATSADLVKLADAIAKRNDELEKEATERANALADAVGVREQLAKRVKELEAEPATPKAAARAVGKEDDAPVQKTADDVLDAQIAKASGEERALLEIKKSLRNPRPLLGAR